MAYGRSKTNKNDLTNLINAALTESQTNQQGGKQSTSPFPGINQRSIRNDDHDKMGVDRSSRYLFLKDKVGNGNYSLINVGNVGKGRTVHLKAYSKDLNNLNKEAAAIGDIPKVHLSRAEHESSQSFSPLPPFLSFNNNTPSLRTGEYDSS